ncbi:MAG: glycosyltransferase [Chitinispirillaceae bacterium]
MNQMTICHFISYFLPVTQNWIYNQLVFNKKCRTVVLCQRRENTGQFPFPQVHPICRKKNLLSVPARAIHKLFEQYPLQPHLTVVNKNKPDILHAHFLLEAWRNYRLIKKLRIPLVTTTYGQDISSLWRKPFWMSRYRKIFDTGKAFMVEGDHMKQILSGLGCPSEKITVVKLGVDLSVIPQKAYEKTQKPVKILFTGLNREKKGAEFAARAFVKSIRAGADLELHLMGNGHYRRQVEQIFKQAGLENKAFFHGIIPVSRYLDLLSRTDIVLAPSVHARDGDSEGGAPVVVIEALAAGIPVVGSRHCDIPNIVEHGTSGLLSDEKDVETLARNLYKLSSDPDLREKMGRKGMEYARAEHDINTQVGKISAVYQQVLNIPK